MSFPARSRPCGTSHRSASHAQPSRKQQVRSDRPRATDLRVRLKELRGLCIDGCNTALREREGKANFNWAAVALTGALKCPVKCTRLVFALAKRFEGPLDLGDLLARQAVPFLVRSSCSLRLRLARRRPRVVYQQSFTLRVNSCVSDAPVRGACSRHSCLHRTACRGVTCTPSLASLSARTLSTSTRNPRKLSSDCCPRRRWKGGHKGLVFHHARPQAPWPGPSHERSRRSPGLTCIADWPSFPGAGRTIGSAQTSPPQTSSAKA